MNETSTVSTLISKLIATAIALGCAGTLGDSILKTKSDAKSALKSHKFLMANGIER